jgi:hypothetical protein
MPRFLIRAFRIENGSSWDCFAWRVSSAMRPIAPVCGSFQTRSIFAGTFAFCANGFPSGTESTQSFSQFTTAALGTEVILRAVAPSFQGAVNKVVPVTK